MEWTELDFGRHTGKTLPQVMFSDPDWFYWAWHEKAFAEKDHLQEEAGIIYARSTSIKIPSAEGKKCIVQYLINEGKFFGFEIVAFDHPAHQGTTSITRSNHLDMEFPRKLSSYDKLGYRHLTDELKRLILLDTNKTRMTKKLCGEYFDDPNRFYESS